MRSYDKKIANKEELIQFMKDIVAGNPFEGKNILLVDDIDMEGVNPEEYWPNEEYRKTYFFPLILIWPERT